MCDLLQIIKLLFQHICAVAEGDTEYSEEFD